MFLCFEFNSPMPTFCWRKVLPVAPMNTFTFREIFRCSAFWKINWKIQNSKIDILILLILVTLILMILPGTTSGTILLQSLAPGPQKQCAAVSTKRELMTEPPQVSRLPSWRVIITSAIHGIGLSVSWPPTILSLSSDLLFSSSSELSALSSVHFSSEKARHCSCSQGPICEVARYDGWG